MADVKPEKKIVVLNNSKRSYHVGKGAILAPGASMELVESVAKNILDYDGVVDASKLVTVASSIDVVAQNTKLKLENAMLKGEIEKLKKSSTPPTQPPAK